MDQEVFICAAARTPIGRYGGALATVRPDDMAAHVISAVIQRSGAQLDPAAIDEVIFGCANQAGEDNRNVARMGLLIAGLPETVPGVTMNRLCASGLDAVAAGARQIRCGEAQLLIVGGTESMTRAPYVMGKSGAAFGRDARLEDTTLGWRFINPRLRERCGVDTMAETAENVAQQFAVTRAAQDAYALQSQQRFAAARAAGFFDTEIAPIDVPGERGRGTRSVAQDEHPRPDTTLVALAGLKPVVRSGGSVTAGNSSGINDGAAALVLASAAAVKRFGLTPRARILGSQSAGVPPRIMGIGPVTACQKLLARLNLGIADLSAIEVNEAFAAQVLAVLQGLGVAADDPRVNPNGGAIAIGHPLGASGARLVLTSVNQLQRGGARYAMASMCVGVGQGVAMMIERV
ncbi:MAG: 3-oxoadipyl-CoA thiolase [Steroidobacteraceae bacterium]